MASWWWIYVVWGYGLKMEFELEGGFWSAGQADLEPRMLQIWNSHPSPGKPLMQNVPSQLH